MKPTRFAIAALAAAAGSLLWLSACKQGTNEESTAATASAPAETMPVTPAASGDTATAVIAGTQGSKLAGTAVFTQTADGGVDLVVNVTGAPSGEHGIHLHDKGDCSAPDFSSAGGHFNPTNAPHGGPNSPQHHAGDFGNITVAADGTGHLSLHSNMLTVAAGPNSVVGHAVVIHQKADDLKSQPSGNSGARIGCGVVKEAATKTGTSG
jgi:superoxide dismutase, Cu-Zn family